MKDPRDDPVNLFMDQWRRGGAKDAILGTMGTKHIPERHYSDAMKFRSQERERYEQMKDLAANQEGLMAESTSMINALVGTVTQQREENSKLRQQRDVFSKFILDNANALRGRSDSVRAHEATEAGGSQSQGGQSRTGGGRPGAVGKRGAESAEPLRGHERTGGGGAERLDDEANSAEREGEALEARE